MADHCRQDIDKRYARLAAEAMALQKFIEEQASTFMRRAHEVEAIVIESGMEAEYAEPLAIISKLKTILDALNAPGGE